MYRLLLGSKSTIIEKSILFCNFAMIMTNKVTCSGLLLSTASTENNVNRKQIFNYSIVVTMGDVIPRVIRYTSISKLL